MAETTWTENWPLTRYYQAGDDDRIAPAIRAQVDAVFTTARPQHEARRWEYGLTLTAIQSWAKGLPEIERRTLRVADVGGAGSPFRAMLPGQAVTVIDPDADPSDAGAVRQPLEGYVVGASHGPAHLFDVVTCLSVIEHVPPKALDTFLYHLTSLVRPGGLLVLTCDTCGCSGGTLHEPTADPHHFSWMRTQMITRPVLLRVLNTLVDHDHCDLLGGVDLQRPPAPLVYDYTFASLVLRKDRS